MTEHEASRTLVKSPPELWAECSSAEALTRHLNGSFGDIRITRLEPETAVAWEGELASGTVRLEPSGWGTKVILTARPEDAAEPQPARKPEPAPEPEAARGGTRGSRRARAGADPRPEPEPEPEPAPEPVAEAATPEITDAPARVGFMARMRAMFGGGKTDEPVAVAEPEPVAAEPEPDPAPAPEPAPIAVPTPVTTFAAERAVDPEAVLSAALDSLGQAHHRPFSRA